MKLYAYKFGNSAPTPIKKGEEKNYFFYHHCMEEMQPCFSVQLLELNTGINKINANYQKKWNQIIIMAKLLKQLSHVFSKKLSRLHVYEL